MQMKNLTITPSDLDLIKQFANKRFLENQATRHLDSAQYFVLCYVEAMDAFLNKKGINISIKLKLDVSEMPYEPTE